MRTGRRRWLRRSTVDAPGPGQTIHIRGGLPRTQEKGHPTHVRVYLVTTAKGGPGKTTTAVFLGFALARRKNPDTGRTLRVLLVCADPASQGLSDWLSLVAMNGGYGDLDLHVRMWTYQTGLLVPFVLSAIETIGDVDRVVIDTGGEAMAVSKQAGTLADLVISPLGPTPIEARRAPATAMLFQDIDVAHCVLLTRVDNPHRGRAAELRTELEAQGFDVLVTEVPNNKTLYADPYGTIPSDSAAYEGVADEVESMEL